MKTMVTRVGVLFVLGAFLSACAGAESCRSRCPKPVWVDKPPKLAAVGHGKGIDAGLCRSLAEDDARHKLAREISVKVSGLLEESFKQVAGAEAGELYGHKYAQGITRTLHHQYLSGTHVVEYFDDCCSERECYALVTLEKDGMLQAANAAAKEAAKKLMGEAEEKHKELQKALDEAIKKEFGE